MAASENKDEYILKSYEKYRSWFTTGANGFCPDRGFTAILSRGMKEWMNMETNDTIAHKEIAPGHKRSVISSNELVNLLATALGGD